MRQVSALSARWAIGYVLFGVPVAAPANVHAQARSIDPAAVHFVTTDIGNFWDAYDRLATAATRADSIDAFRTHYLDLASPGLRAFFPARIQSIDRMLGTLESRPRYFAAIRPNTLLLGAAEPRIRDALRRFERLYPAAQFPDIYFVIGIYNTAGMLTSAGLIFGAEMLAADAETPTDELPQWAPPIETSSDAIACLVVHELVHAQQEYPPGRFLLAQSLREGIANFLARLTVGCPGSAATAYEYGDAHERELWEEFYQAMAGAYTDWLYNAHRSSDRPGNLGYWMGDRIAESYYNQAPDKERAVYDLLHISDYGAFLEASGYGGKWDGRR